MGKYFPPRVPSPSAIDKQRNRGCRDLSENKNPKGSVYTAGFVKNVLGGGNFYSLTCHIC